MFLVDNSLTTLNGDVRPTRFKAQTDCVTNLSIDIVHQGSPTMAGLGTLSGNFGVVLSLTHDRARLGRYLETIHREGAVQFDRAVKCGIFALRQRTQDIRHRRLLIFLGSHHTMTVESANELANCALSNRVSVILVTFGSDPIDMAPLEAFVNQTPNSKLIRVAPGRDLIDVVRSQVRDSILSSSGAPATNDPELAAILRQSAQEAGVEIDDPELAQAIAESQQEQASPPRPPPQVQTQVQDAPPVQVPLPPEVAPPVQAQVAAPVEAGQEAGDDEFDPDELEQAVRMSKEGGGQGREGDDVEGLAEALAASREVTADARNRTQREIDEFLADPDRVRDFFKDFPGVDPNDPRFRDLGKK
jgi:hypothetical protein